MVVGIEPPPSPHGAEGPALALIGSGLLVLDGTAGVQLLWLALVAAIALARPNLAMLAGRGGVAGTDGGGAGGEETGGDGLPGPRGSGPTPGGGTR